MTKNQTLERLLDIVAAKAAFETTFKSEQGSHAYYKTLGALDRVQYDLKEDVKKFMKTPSERKKRKR